METLQFWANVLFGLFLSGICIPQSLAFPPTRPSQNALFQRPQQAQRPLTEEPPKAREQVNTISVTCHPDLLEIVIKADMFAVGAPVSNHEIRLGVDEDYYCRATVSSEDEYKIAVGLMDCGTKHWMTEDSLVYTNLLIYSPAPSPNGVIRMDEAVIPIECHYERKYSLSSSSLTPSWLAFTSTMSAVENLEFNLKLMTDDWQYERGSQVYFLGDPINIEASVRLGHHMKLRVFLSSCVATLYPDMHSEPKYVFLEDGCLMDSAVPGSKSHFLPRTQENSLQMAIDAFKFHNDNRGEIYITCHMNAVPLDDAEAPNKACTLANGRWRSADGNDYLCGYCQSQNEVDESRSKLDSTSRYGPRGFGKPVELESSWRSGLRTNKVWEQETRLGPMTVLPRTKSLLPLDELPPVLAKLNRPSLYGSQWRSGNGKQAVEEETLPGPPAQQPDVTTEGDMTEDVDAETEDDGDDDYVSLDETDPDFMVESALLTTTDAPSEPPSTPEAEEEETIPTNATAAQPDPKK